MSKKFIWIIIIVVIIILSIWVVTQYQEQEPTVGTPGSVSEAKTPGNVSTINEPIGETIIEKTIEASEITPKKNQDSKYEKAISLGGERFINNQDENFLYYEYNYKKDEFSTIHQSMREMGAMRSVIELYKYLEDDRYYDLATRGFKYFEETFKEDENGDFLFSNITPHKIKLGYNAFLILTLIDIEHPQKVEYLEKLAAGILSQQLDDWELDTFFFIDRSSGKDYYPWEALLSLIKLYQYNKNEKYLNAVEKALWHYIWYRDSNPNTAFVPWQTRAYYDYYMITEDERASKLIFDMNDFMLDSYKPKANCSKYTLNQGIVTSVHTEAVIKAYLLAKELWDSKRENCYYNFIKEAADYTLTLQITDIADHYELPALWGFRWNPSSSKMRVDRNQHSVLMLMDAVNAGIIK